MNVTQRNDNEQSALWNGAAGRAWVEAQVLLDTLFRPFEELLVQAVSPESSASVLDVGCGTGGTTVSIARRLGLEGRCIGIDISEPMIEAARQRAEREGSRASFLCANAQFHAFEPESFDTILSRFGVMFFSNSVEAFANLRRVAKRDAELQFIAWRSAAENPFMTTAERAAAPILPNLPSRRPDEPGQFAFADRRRIQSILEESGWAGIDIEPINVACAFPQSELVLYLARFGPVGRVLQEANDETRSHVVGQVLSAFKPYIHGNEVRFAAACWMVRATAPLLHSRDHG